MSYDTVRTLAEVEALVAGETGDRLVLAGGTDLMVRRRARVASAAVLDVGRVPELCRVALEDDELVLGAAVTYAVCQTDPTIRRACPLLVRVAERFASPQIRQVATLGGNVANASPAGDGVAALFALDARVEALTRAGRITVPIAEVVRGPGQLGLPAGSVLVAFRVPIAVSGEGSAFYKLVNRAWPEHPMAIAVASVATRLRVGGDGRVELVRVVLGAVAPTPVRAAGAEGELLGRRPDGDRMREAAARVAEAAQPIADVRASAAYRQEVLAALAATALATAVRDAVGHGAGYPQVGGGQGGGAVEAPPPAGR